jgi:hypothetical protein
MSHERRSRFLAATAAGLGLRADAERWAAENWRIVLLRHLTGSGGDPSIRDIVHASRRQGRSGPRAAAVAAFALTSWVLPHRFGLWLAGTVVHPDLLQ